MRKGNKISTPLSSPSQKQNAHYADLLQKYGNSSDIRNKKNSKHHSNYIDDETVDKNLISSIFDTPKVIIKESIIDAKNSQYQKELTKKRNPRLTEDQKTQLIDRLTLSRVIITDDDHQSSQSTPRKKYNGTDFNSKFINSRFEGVNQSISLAQLEVILRYFTIIDHYIDDKPLISQELLPLCQIDDQSYDSEKLKEALLQSFSLSSENSFWLEVSNCIKSARLNGKMKTYIKSPAKTNSRKDQSHSISSQSHEKQQIQEEIAQFSDDLSYTTDDEREQSNYPNIFKEYITYSVKDEQLKPKIAPTPDKNSDPMTEKLPEKDIADKNSNNQIIEENKADQTKKFMEEEIIEEEEEVENDEEQIAKEEEDVINKDEDQILKEEENIYNNDEKEQISNEEKDIINRDIRDQFSNEEEKPENEIKQISSEEVEYNDNQINQNEEESILSQIPSEKLPPSQKKRKNFHKKPQPNQNPDPNKDPEPLFQADEYEYNYYSEEQYIKSNLTFDDLIQDAASQPVEDQEFQSIVEETSYSKDFLSYDSIDYDNDDDLYIKVKTRRKSRHRKSPKSQAASPIQDKVQNINTSKSYCNRHHHHHHHRHKNHHNSENVNNEELFDRLKIVQPNQSEHEDVAVQVDSNSKEKNSKGTNPKFSSSESVKYPLTVPIEDVDAEDLKQFEDNLTDNNDQD